ncbi:MAG: putative Glycosyl hydrolase, family 13 [Gemmatimonadetes bacterium]|nr:putative Glycosyl hydrolase, family 13 [Gemmatimonadota bacterium]
MSDPDLERRVASALRTSHGDGAGVRDAVMARVRAIPEAERPRRRARYGVRAVRHSMVGAALAASVGSVATLSTIVGAPRGTPAALATAVIGDSVSATLRDTLRLVRLMFDDTAARQVVAVVDAGATHPGRTALRRDAGGRWSATVALRDGAHRYAFVVDATRWVLDPSAPRVRAADGRLYSLLQVSANAN